MNLETFWFLTAGTYVFNSPTGLSLTLSEILPDLSPDPAAVTVTQHVGRNNVSYQPGQALASGLPITFTVVSACTVTFTSPAPGLEVVATPTAAGDLSEGQTELVTPAGGPPSIRTLHEGVVYTVALTPE